MTLIIVGSCVACMAAGAYTLIVIVREFDSMRNRE